MPASLATSLRPFLAMEIMERAFELERAGHRVLHLELGEPDFDPPAAAVTAATEALARGETRYTDSRGLLELREAIARDLRGRSGVEVSPERILVTSGTSPAMLIAFSILLERGVASGERDAPGEVVMASPHYPCYPNFVRYCGGEPVFVPTRSSDGHRLDVDAMRRAVTPRTRAVLVNSPSNPTGAVQSEDTLRALAELGLPIVSDEIYDGLVYDDVRTTSALAVSEEAFVLDGFSKRYAMTGFRLGYLVAPARAVRPAQILLQNLFISANAFVQRAGIAALEHGDATLREMRRAYRRRRDLLVEGLRGLGFGVPKPPEGAFYVLAEARRFGADSLALASEILERVHVGVTPGVDFGEAGEGMLRFCYAVSESTIEEALARLAGILPELEARAEIGAAR